VSASSRKKPAAAIAPQWARKNAPRRHVTDAPDTLPSMWILLDEGPDRSPTEIDAIAMPRLGEFIRIEEPNGHVDFAVEGVMHNFHRKVRADRDHVATLKVRRITR
jgi:hypothetical protein